MAEETPPLGNRDFRNEIIKIADLAVTETELADLTFSNCRIMGPAVLVPRETQFVECKWESADFDAMFWEIRPDRKVVLGAIGLTRCTFSHCTFTLIGLAGPPEMGKQMREGATPGS